MHPVPLIGLAVAALLIFAVWTALRHDRRRAAAREAAARAADAERARAAVAAVPDALREKLERGECRFCARRAEYRVPRVVHARPVLDALLRRLGAVPTVQFQLRLAHDDLDAPVELCRAHRERARSLLEVELGEVPAAYAKFADGLTRHLIAFQSTELYARMEADATADSKRKPRARAAGAAAAAGAAGGGPASVVTLADRKRAANGDGGAGGAGG